MFWTDFKCYCYVVCIMGVGGIMFWTDFIYYCVFGGFFRDCLLIWPRVAGLYILLRNNCLR